MNIKMLLGSIFSFIGAIFFIIGISTFINNKNFMKTAIPIDAYIEQIVVYTDSDDDVNHEVYITYDYGGQEYKKVRFNTYTSSMYEGQTIEIYINPNNPLKSRLGNEGYLFSIIFGGIGGLFLIIGIIFITLFFKQKVLFKKLKQTGIKKYLKIIDIVEDVNIIINGNHPYFLICEDIDEYSGEKRFLKSNSSSLNFNDSYIGNSVAIYIDSNNKNIYYMDVKDIL